MQCYLNTLIHNRVEVLVVLQTFEFVGIILRFGDRQNPFLSSVSTYAVHKHS